MNAIDEVSRGSSCRCAPRYPPATDFVVDIQGIPAQAKEEILQSTRPLFVEYVLDALRQKERIQKSMKHFIAFATTLLNWSVVLVWTLSHCFCLQKLMVKLTQTVTVVRQI